MGRPGGPVASFRQLRPGNHVHFYSADGWKKGHISQVHDASASIRWSQGSNEKITNVYDTRNIRFVQS